MADHYFYVLHGSGGAEAGSNLDLFGMFLKSGERTEAVETMLYLWTGTANARQHRL